MSGAIDTVLFDLDGTIADSIELILSAYRHTMQQCLGCVPADELWLSGLGTPLATQLNDFATDAEQHELMRVTFRDFSNQYHDDMLSAYEGIPEVIRHLKAGGYKLGLVTSKNRASSLRAFRLLDLMGIFEVLVCSDDVERHKPDPLPVRQALAQLGSEPAAAIFVGDSPHDMVSGRGAGVRTAAACWGPFTRAHLEPSEPDYWLQKPADLLSLV
jgi:pyrophosphatase PpaX